MGATLQSVKERLKHRCLGKYGVHGIGISRAENAIQLYVSPDSEVESPSIFHEIAKEALPFRVIVVKEERPTAR